MTDLGPTALEDITQEERAFVQRALDMRDDEWETAHSGHLLEYVSVLRSARAVRSGPAPVPLEDIVTELVRRALQEQFARLVEVLTIEGSSAERIKATLEKLRVALAAKGKIMDVTDAFSRGWGSCLLLVTNTIIAAAVVADRVSATQDPPPGDGNPGGASA